MSKPYRFKSSTKQSNKPLALIATNMVQLLERMEKLEQMMLNLNSRMSAISNNNNPTQRVPNHDDN